MRLTLAVTVEELRILPGPQTMIQGDCLTILRERFADESVQCCVTSPPYWGLRDYGTATWQGGDEGCDHKQGRPGAGRADGIVDDRNQRNRDGVGSMGGDCRKCGAKRIDDQIGIEKTPEEYVAKMVAVFREVRRVLRDDGTLWLNLGDSYAANTLGGASARPKIDATEYAQRRIPIGLKPKDLVGIPWRVAFALQADGWYLRSDIIWHKPNPMPESVTDRPTKSHEYLFLLSKSAKYYYDAEAIAEPFADERMGNPGRYKWKQGEGGVAGGGENSLHKGGGVVEGWKVDGKTTGRNRRSVWTVATQPYSEAHFATFPPKLIEPCILAGCPSGGLVLDPFAGSGTTIQVAQDLGRRGVGIELNPQYIALAEERTAQTGLPL